MNKKISVDHVCRVEGYGGILVEVKDGKITSVQMKILEGARFLEPLVVGRRFDEVPDIICRICAICSSVHKITSIQAIEKALDIKVSNQTKLLRELLILGGNIESHALHVFCLILPDLFKKNSVVGLVDDYSNEVLIGLNLKKMGNYIQELIGGRAIHGVNAIIGGFGKSPDIESIKTLKSDLETNLAKALKSINLLKDINLTNYSESPTVYAALKPINREYSLFGNEIITSDNDSFPIDKYMEFTNEYVVSHSNAKHSKYNNNSFMVGALARLILNKEDLKGVAKVLIESLNIPLPTNNILYNNFAQAVEIVWSMERAIEICNILIKKGIIQEKLPNIKIKSGHGVEAIEAPRGTLYHSYKIDNKGYITYADVITPTAQNCANIEKDLYATANNLKNLADEEIKFNLEMIVRAYDPCISCSVH